MATNDKVFHLEATKGYIFKIIIDVLSNSVPRCIFVLNKSGILLRQPDSGLTVLFNIDLPRENFKKFKCLKQKVISFNTKHVQKLLKNVKKKDSVSLFINKGNLGNLGITIRPEGAKRTSRFETNYVVYQEEKNYELLELPPGKYKYPVVIDSMDYQKLKRLANNSKVINVKMQKDNYLSFKCDLGNVCSSELGFGKLLNMEEEEDEEEEDEEEDEEKEDNEGEAEEDDETKEKNDKELYEAQFYASILNSLVKLPGLCSQMQFYSPSIPHYPLKIKMNAGQAGVTLGYVEVYIKDVHQITYEESLRQETENTEIPLKKSKSKKK